MRILAAVLLSSIVISVSCLGAESHELVEKILKNEQSAFEELNDLSDAERFDVLFSSYYTTQAAKVWQEEHSDIVDKIRENLNRTPYLEEGLIAKFEKVMKPKNGRQRELLFRVAGTLNRDVVTPLVADFLADQRSFENPVQEGQPNRYIFEPSNSYLAARTLGEMGIAKPPTDKDPLTYRGAEVKAWQDWWSKMSKAGELKFDVDHEIDNGKAISPDIPNVAPSDEGIEAKNLKKISSRLPIILGAITLIVILVILVRAAKNKSDPS